MSVMEEWRSWKDENYKHSDDSYDYGGFKNMEKVKKRKLKKGEDAKTDVWFLSIFFNNYSNFST